MLDSFQVKKLGWIFVTYLGDALLSLNISGDTYCAVPTKEFFRDASLEDARGGNAFIKAMLTYININKFKKFNLSTP